MLRLNGIYWKVRSNVNSGIHKAMKVINLQKNAINMEEHIRMLCINTA